MKKEAINTFSEGMVMDLHPLTTPANVLTNCLNGTTITYNGNEFVLQNDMGNGEVHTAYLDKGYVPVGMKEHGGIIYIAAHNPITGKSQIGSFPSPQQLYEGEDLNVTPIQFDFSTFIDTSKGIPYIKLEHYKQKLFQTNNSDEVKIFHPGDRFVITCDQIDSTIRTAISDGVIKLRLGVLNSSGFIDYIDDKNLKLYDNGLWIYENSNTPMLDVIKSKELVQVFSAKSSGALILILELKTFDTFNLIRKYSYDGGIITVTFTGETTGKYTGTTKKNPETIGLVQENSLNVLPEIKANSAGINPYTYKIMPTCPYGVLERMAKNGTIDFDFIRTNSQRFGEWRFYVTETYLKVGWGYDYYNLNEDSDIERVDFVFIDLTDSNSASNADNLKGAYTYTISKEYYNGSFEEIIPFSGSTIQKNWIYIVRVDRYVKGVKQVIGYKVVYTGGYFNDYYSSVPDFATGLDSNGKQILPNGTSRPKNVIKYKSDISSSIKPGDINTWIKVNDSTAFTPNNFPRPTDFIKEVDSMDTQPNYRYNTKKVGNYDVSVKLAVDYDYDSKQLAGTPDSSIITNFFNTVSASFDTPDNSNILFNSDSPLTSEISTIESSTGTFKVVSSSNGVVELKSTASTSRNMIAANGPVKSVSFDVEKMLPVYQPSIDATERQKLFSFREENGVLYCVTGDEDYICYNSRITGDAHTEGSYKGVNGGAGVDHGGLRVCLINMGNGTVGIFGGHDCDHASLRYEGTSYGGGAWYRDDREVDDEDNFLIATWKDRDGNHWPVNLASRKTESSDVASSSNLIRVEKMLKCFLSQMLVAKRSSRTINFVGPNSSDYSYHNQFKTTCDININLQGGLVDVNFYLSNSKDSIETHMNRWMVAKPEIKNFLPIFSMEKPTTMRTAIEFGDNIRFDTDSNILNCYTSAYSYYTISNTNKLTDAERSKIYIVDPATYQATNIDGSLVFSQSNGEYKRSSSFNTLLTWKGRTSTVSLKYDINSRFVNAYKVNSMTGEIPDGFYNEVFIHNISTKLGTWTKRKDGDAPDIAINVGFGNKSIYNY